jgi:sarcosine oxidase
VVPQTVTYFRLGVPARSLPPWVHFGGAESGMTYGLAELGRDALKAAHHVTQGPDTNPDEVAPPAYGETDALRAVLERILTVPVLESLGTERCLYTMTPTEDFVIDHWPGDPRVAFASACSGHGFKFAPLTGRILAELVVNGRADVPGGPDTASLFALRRAAVPGADAPT